MRRSLTLQPVGGAPIPLAIEIEPDGRFRLELEGDAVTGCLERLAGGGSLLWIGRRCVPFHAVRVGPELHVWLGGEVFRFVVPASAGREAGTAGSSPTGGEVRAPMPGRVIQVLASPGARVAAGDGVAVLESMKVQFRVVAPIAGRVAEVRCAPGQMVELDALLARVEPDAEARQEEPADDPSGIPAERAGGGGGAAGRPAE